MRILTVADCVEPALYRRFGAQRFPRIDLVLSCGDLPPEYLSFLVGATQAPLFYVCGNHDHRLLGKPPEGGVNISGRIVTHGGIKIMGLEGSRWYNGGPFQYTESEMRRIIGALRPRLWFKGGIDLVLAHAPPRHVGDAEDPCHRGFKVYHWLIRKYAPKYFVHGHIHRRFESPEQRVALVDRTRVINSYGHTFLEINDDALAP